MSKQAFFLCILAIAFILKGLVFVALIPMHQGPDEYIHYATVQYLAEPKEKTWTIESGSRRTGNTKEIQDFHYTEEIKKFAELTQSQEFSGAPQNTQNFTPTKVAEVETLMKSGAYPPRIEEYPPDIIRNGILTHQLAAHVERFLALGNPFDRYALARSLSIVYGLITLLCAYCIAFWSGLRKEHALVIAALVAFQPQIGATTAIINYDPLLIAAFSITLLGATSILRHGLRVLNTLTMIFGSLIAIFDKGIGGILFLLTIGVIFWGMRERFPQIKQLAFWKVCLILLILFVCVLFLAPKGSTQLLANIPLESRGKTITQSLLGYFSGGIFDSGKYERTSVTYWGTFGWLDTTLHTGVMQWIRSIEYIAWVGLLIFVITHFANNTILFQKLRLDFKQFMAWLEHEHSFLPDGKFLLLFFTSILLLQTAIRFYDWYGRYMYGEGVGTPGRYFLPNIIPHLILMTTGLGMFVRSSRSFGILLRVLLSLMVLLSFYAIFWIIIPRYYL